MTSTRTFPLRARTAADPEPDLTSMVVIYRAMLWDLERLAVCLASAEEEGIPPARVGAVSRYTTAVLAAMRAHHRGENEILWPVMAAVAGASVDIAPLADDHLAIAAAADTTSRALPGLGAEPGAFSQLRASVSTLHCLLGEHIADVEAQVFPAMRRYLAVGTFRWCQRQIQRRTSLRDQMFTAAWLARHAQPDERRRLRTAGRWQTRILLAARPRYIRLERQAFGGHPRTTTTGGITVHDHEARFHSPVGPQTVLDAFRELTDAKGWQVTSEDEHEMHAQSGPTLRGMGEDMEVSAEPDGQGSQVRVAVRSRMGVLQLVDWGEARIFHGEIVAWLHAWEERGGAER